MEFIRLCGDCSRSSEDGFMAGEGATVQLPGGELGRSFFHVMCITFRARDGGCHNYAFRVGNGLNLAAKFKIWTCERHVQAAVLSYQRVVSS